MDLNEGLDVEREKLFNEGYKTVNLEQRESIVERKVWIIRNTKKTIEKSYGEDLEARNYNIAQRQNILFPKDRKIKGVALRNGEGDSFVKINYSDYVEKYGNCPSEIKELYFKY